jgi:hypothetical protein
VAASVGGLAMVEPCRMLGLSAEKTLDRSQLPKNE